MRLFSNRTRSLLRCQLVKNEWRYLYVLFNVVKNWQDGQIDGDGYTIGTSCIVILHDWCVIVVVCVVLGKLEVYKPTQKWVSICWCLAMSGLAGPGHFEVSAWQYSWFMHWSWGTDLMMHVIPEDVGGILKEQHWPWRVEMRTWYTQPQEKFKD